MSFAHLLPRLVMSVVLGLSFAAPGAAALIDNLLLHSPLDTGTFTGVTAGSTVQDTFGSAQNGTVVNSGLASASGQMGQAFHFPNAGTTYVNYGNVLNPGTNSFTASIWFRPDVLPTGYGFLVGKGSNGTTNDGWAIAVLNNAMEFRINTDTSAMFALDSNVGTVAATQWHHAALVLDRSTNIATAYLNGSSANFVSNGLNIGTGSVTTTSTMVMGVRSVNFNLGLDGTLDDFALWDRALSALEIQEIYAKGLLGFNIQEEVPPPVLPIPEPSSMALLGSLALGLAYRRRAAKRITTSESQGQG